MSSVRGFRPWLALLLALGAGSAAPAARAQGIYQIVPLDPSTIHLRAGTERELEVQLLFDGRPAAGQPIAWRVISSDAGASGPRSTNTDAEGIARARFAFPRAGTSRIEARHPFTGGVVYTVISSPRPEVREVLRLEPVGPTQRALVLGDRDTLAVRLTHADGRPAPGLPVEFAVVQSPGSPGIERSDQTVSTDADGVASASFGFSTAGVVVIEARPPISGSPYDAQPALIQFHIGVSSLGTLVPERQSYRSAAEALDAICLDVFTDPDGNPRPVPQPAPLCVYMTAVVTDQEGRAEAIRALTATGIGAQSATALAGFNELTASVQSRLSALRGTALRYAVDQLALSVDGVQLDGELLRQAAQARPAALEAAVDAGLARLYASLDAQEAPAAAPAATAPRRERPWGFFVTGRLSRGSGETGVEEDGFDFDTAGVTAGIDRAVGANGFIGIALSGLRHETDLEGQGGTLDSDGTSATFYAIREGQRGYAQFTAAYGQSQYDQARALHLPVVGDLTARAEFDGDQAGATLELGRSIDWRFSSLTLFGRASYSRATVDGFRETGAVASAPPLLPGPVDFGLEVGDQDLDSLLGEAGVDWGRAFSAGGGLIIPQLTLNWTHEFSASAQKIGARFLGDVAGVGNFFVFTDDPDRDWLTASAALRFQYLWGSFFVAYDHELLRDDLTVDTLNAGLRFEF
jgi:hypothetical protein